MVKIPYATYVVQESLKVSLTTPQRLIIRGYFSNGKQPLIKTSAFITLLDISSPLSSPNGRVTVEGLALQGNNMPFSSQHPYFDKGSFVSGIRISNMAEAAVLDNQISNFYGEGLYVGYTNAGTSKPPHRFSHIEIDYNDVIHC